MSSVPTETTLEVLTMVKSKHFTAPRYFAAGNLALFLSQDWDGAQVHEGDVHGVCNFRLLAVDEANSESPETVVHIEASYFIGYGNAGSLIAKGEAIDFLKKVGRMAVYPYFRSHVSNIAAAAQLDLPLLPTVTIGTFELEEPLRFEWQREPSTPSPDATQ